MSQKCKDDVSFIQAGRVFKNKTGFIKALAPKYVRKRIQHVFVARIDNSVLRVTVWHHSAEPCDAN